MRAAAVSALMAVGISAAFGQQETPRYVERVEVTRVLIDARVMDDKGTPLTDLGVEDFAVRIGGKAARIESVEWVSGSAAHAVPTLDARGVRGIVETAPERLIVFLLQKSFEGGRLPGLMRTLLGTRGFLERFGPRDRIAVLLFDHHLEVRLDFTNDRERVRHVLERALVDPPPPLQEGVSPSLAKRLDPERVQRTYSIERALRLIGEALQDVPGSKSIVLLGYGFGRLNPSTGSVSMENDYEKAREALLSARASVFSLDVTNADYHSLEAGLQLVSAATGGFFARTHLFQDRAFNLLSGVLAGHYVLFVERPDLEPGTHRVDVKLTRKKAKVLARSSWDFR